MLTFEPNSQYTFRFLLIIQINCSSESLDEPPPFHSLSSLFAISFIILSYLHYNDGTHLHPSQISIHPLSRPVMVYESPGIGWPETERAIPLYANCQKDCDSMSLPHQRISMIYQLNVNSGLQANSFRMTLIQLKFNWWIQRMLKLNSRACHIQWWIFMHDILGRRADDSCIKSCHQFECCLLRYSSDHDHGDLSEWITLSATLLSSLWGLVFQKQKSRDHQNMSSSFYSQLERAWNWSKVNID